MTTGYWIRCRTNQHLTIYDRKPAPNHGSNTLQHSPPNNVPNKAVFLCANECNTQPNTAEFTAKHYINTHRHTYMYISYHIATKTKSTNPTQPTRPTHPGFAFPPFLPHPRLPHPSPPPPLAASSMSSATERKALSSASSALRRRFWRQSSSAFASGELGTSTWDPPKTRAEGRLPQAPSGEDRTRGSSTCQRFPRNSASPPSGGVEFFGGLVVKWSRGLDCGRFLLNPGVQTKPRGICPNQLGELVRWTASHKLLLCFKLPKGRALSAQ